MKQITNNGVTYLYNKSKLYDEAFLEIPKYEALPILEQYYSSIDYTKFNEIELRIFIGEIKDAELHHFCIKVCEYALNKYSDLNNFIASILAIITSSYRAIGKPQDAIDFWQKYQTNLIVCENESLYTSLAAAYCDLGKYETARKTANKAYAIGGNSPELSLVYERIKSAIGE